MIVEILIGAAAGAVIGGVIAYFLDEIVNWGKQMFKNLASWIRRAIVKIKRLPGAIKQFLYYVENGTVKVKTETRDATEDEIDELRKSMNEQDWNKFINGKQTDVADLEREDD